MTRDWRVEDVPTPWLEHVLQTLRAMGIRPEPFVQGTELVIRLTLDEGGLVPARPVRVRHLHMSMLALERLAPECRVTHAELCLDQVRRWVDELDRHPA